MLQISKKKKQFAPDNEVDVNLHHFVYCIVQKKGVFVFGLKKLQYIKFSLQYRMVVNMLIIFCCR